jgi:CHRD domain
VDGPADQAHAPTVAFYRAHGFAADTDSILHDAAHQVTVAVEARDHSTRRTFIAIGVGPRAPSSGRVALAARLTGHGRGRATVTFAGARACWTIRGLRGVAWPSGATIRQGTAGRSGPVIVRLGRAFRASGCTTVAPALGQAIAARPAGFYLSVATRAHPGGAVRGQLRRS